MHRRTYFNGSILLAIILPVSLKKVTYKVYLWYVSYYQVEKRRTAGEIKLRWPRETRKRQHGMPLARCDSIAQSLQLYAHTISIFSAKFIVYIQVPQTRRTYANNLCTQRLNCVWMQARRQTGLRAA